MGLYLLLSSFPAWQDHALFFLNSLHLFVSILPHLPKVIHCREYIPLYFPSCPQSPHVTLRSPPPPPDLTLEELDALSLPPHVHRLAQINVETREERRVFIVGTAHVSLKVFFAGSILSMWVGVWYLYVCISDCFSGRRGLFSNSDKSP